MIRINARGDESVGQMIKRFQRMCQKEGLTRDIRRNSYYEKPSERRRRRLRKSLRRSLSAGR
ncbi:MAG: 30S ribosomal protein S21 [Phycisphaerae bacterium]